MKDPAFLFYPGDWMGGTQWLTFEQKGCYMELLILQFNVGKFTESQAKQVLSICFDHAWIMLKQKFIFEDGLYWNERLKLEIEKRKKYSESRRNNGLQKKTKSKKTKKHMPKHMEDENDNEDVVIISSFLNIDFEDFWNEYDKKIGEKTKLRKKWENLTDNDRQNIMYYIPMYKKCQPDKSFRKNPETFLNNKSWNDEIIFSNGGKQKQRSVSEREFELDGIVSGVYTEKGMG